MKNKEVYILTMDTSIDYERSLDVRVFDSMDKAQQAYFDWREDKIKQAKEYGWMIGIMNGIELSAYEEGYHAQNHFDAVIEKVKVE